MADAAEHIEDAVIWGLQDDYLDIAFYSDDEDL